MARCREVLVQDQGYIKMTLALTFKTCSNCANWSRYTTTVDDVLASQCSEQRVINGNLGLSPKVTKGSDSCSKWSRK